MLKGLEWEMRPVCDGPVMAKAETIIGTYFICDDTDDFSGLYCDFVSMENATWFGSGKVKSEQIFSGKHFEGDQIETLLFPLVENHYEGVIKSAFSENI